MSVSYIIRRVSIPLIFIVLCGFNGARGQAFSNDPFIILKEWDYHRLVDYQGEGEQIVAYSNGKPYLAGFSYEETWLNRKCEISYFFKKTDIDRFQLRIYHPRPAMKDEKVAKLWLDPANRDSLIEVFRIQDSIRQDSIRQLILEKPGLTVDFNERTKLSNKNKTILDQDSIRCDSIIDLISKELGPPLSQGVPLHTNKTSRYSAYWLTNGYSCSLTHSTGSIDVFFAISKIDPRISQRFGVDSRIEVILKRLSEQKNGKFNISLLGLPSESEPLVYQNLYILIESDNKVFLEECFPGMGGINPELRIMDVDGDQIDEIWIMANHPENQDYEEHQLFTIALSEPISIFNSNEEINELWSASISQEKNLQLTDADGTEYELQLEKNSQGFNNLESLKVAVLKLTFSEPDAKLNRRLMVTMGIHGADDTKIICTLNVDFQLYEGIWIPVVSSFQQIDTK